MEELIAAVVAAVIAAAVAFAVASRTVHHERNLNAKRTALDIIRGEISPDWGDVKARARNAIANPAEWDAVLEPKNTEDYQRRADVVTFLNHQEMIAIAVKWGILDESLFQDWARHTYVSTWAAVHAFVIRWRQHTHTRVLVEFEGLATAWSKKFNITLAPPPMHGNPGTDSRRQGS